MGAGDRNHRRTRLLPAALLPDLQHDLAARVSARDPLQRLAHLLEGNDRLDLGAQLACVDQPAERFQPLPGDFHAERVALDAPLELSGLRGAAYTAVLVRGEA